MAPTELGQSLLGENKQIIMSADIANKLDKYLDVSEYVATFEANLNKGELVLIPSPDDISLFCCVIRVKIKKFIKV